MYVSVSIPLAEFIYWCLFGVFVYFFSVFFFCSKTCTFPFSPVEAKLLKDLCIGRYLSNLSGSFVRISGRHSATFMDFTIFPVTYKNHTEEWYSFYKLLTAYFKHLLNVHFDCPSNSAFCALKLKLNLVKLNCFKSTIITAMENIGLTKEVLNTSVTQERHLCDYAFNPVV